MHPPTNLPNFSNLPTRKILPYVSLESEGCESADIALKLVVPCILCTTSVLHVVILL